MGRLLDEDPLALDMAPPPDETAEAKEARLRAEARAKKISEEIDEGLRAERAAMKKKPPVKVLLLGQSESGESYLSPLTLDFLFIFPTGKSTTLKSEHDPMTPSNVVQRGINYSIYQISR